MGQHYVGLDVSLEMTSVCVLEEKGKVLWRGKVASTPEAIAEAIRAHAPEVARIGLETGPLCTWHWHALRSTGLPVVCLDARHAKAVLSLQLNKTDANDAFGLAQIVRMGWYREVAVKELDDHRVRALLSSRAQLVDMRRDLGTKIRGLLKTFGRIVGKVGDKEYTTRVRELAIGVAGLEEAVLALLAVRERLEQQIGLLDQRILELARRSDVCRRLTTIPGVGTLTALSFVAAIGDPSRFRKSCAVGAYFGLTPKRHQSGEIDYDGKISRCGDGLTRTYLFEAAGVLLARVTRWSALKAWGTRLAKRVGSKKARVALARKLAVLMHRVWVDGTEFRWSKEPAVA